LNEGVTVIAAHACGYGFMLYEKFYPTLLELIEKYPNFYADVSALTLPNRFRMLLCLRDIMRTRNRFDRQFKVCESLGIGFHSFEQVVKA
jgi:hypothetical protein